MKDGLEDNQIENEKKKSVGFIPKVKEASGSDHTEAIKELAECFIHGEYAKETS